METKDRREKILEILREQNEPLSGADLAKQLFVSRQVIVQDIALLRATNKNILSTNKGYLLYKSDEGKKSFQRTIKVKHSREDTRDELYTVVDLGGRFLDVVVEHEIYGQINVDLIIHSRMDVDIFLQQAEKTKDRLLNDLTRGIHFHTIEADTAERLDLIEEKMKEKGYLIT
ncbi:MAG: transcription repressor NadR [Clostridiales bacterium]|mgnify:CR=1 FL=1|nr:transcription repressor NadR [Clostridiales bacterium]